MKHPLKKERRERMVSLKQLKLDLCEPKDLPPNLKGEKKPLAPWLGKERGRGVEDKGQAAGIL